MILVGSIMLLATSLSAQQSHDRPGWYIGPFIGGVVTELHDEYSTSDARLDFSVGVQFEKVYEHGGLMRLGAFYAGRGAKDREKHYVEFPLLLGYRLPDTGRTRVFFMSGGQAAIGGGCQGQSFECSQSQCCDVALLVGGGVSLPAGKSSLVVDLRYLEGFIDDGFGKNRGVTIGAAYMFALGHGSDR